MRSSADGGPAPRSGKIARDLGLARNTVSKVLAQVQARRARRCRRTACETAVRGSSTRYESIVQELLARYPELTAVRLLEELRQRGFRGGYTMVRQRLAELRPRSSPAPVIRFETAPGAQAQMDYAVYDIDFTAEGRRRVYAVQLYPGLLAPPVSAIRRVPGPGDHPARARARLRPSGRCGRNLLV